MSMTKPQAAEMLAMLCAYYHREVLPEETERLWILFLTKYPADEAYRGLSQTCEQSKFFPSIAEARVAIQSELHASRLREQGERRALASRSAAPRGYASRAAELMGSKADGTGVLGGKRSAEEALAILHGEFGCPAECRGHRGEREERNG